MEILKISRQLGFSLFIILTAIGTGCRREPAPESPAPVRTLLLELQATIIDHAWAAGSEAFVAFDGSTMLVPNGAGGISIYGLGNPGHPALLATVDCSTMGGQGGAVAAANGRAFVAVMGTGMIAELDISTLSIPIVVNRFSASTEFDQLELRGNHLFVHFGPSGSAPGGVFVFDISQTPAALIGQYLAQNCDPGFCVSDSKRVFQARPEYLNWTAQIDAVDMADPANPKLLFTWPSSRSINIMDMCEQDGRLYCAAYLGGIFVLNETAQDRQYMEAQFDWSEIHSCAWSVAVVQPYVFVARGDSNGAAGSFQAFRLEGSSLTIAWEQAAGFAVHSVAISGNLLVTVEQEPPVHPMPEKVLKLYRIFAED